MRKEDVCDQGVGERVHRRRIGRKGEKLTGTLRGIPSYSQNTDLLYNPVRNTGTSDRYTVF
jgi:hypothetical protein